MKKKRERKLLMSAEPWPLDEVSTRNCYNCLAPTEGIELRCRKGHDLSEYSYNGAVRLIKILKPCQECFDFDNDWN